MQRDTDAQENRAQAQEGMLNINSLKANIAKFLEAAYCTLYRRSCVFTGACPYEKNRSFSTSYQSYRRADQGTYDSAVLGLR